MKNSQSVKKMIVKIVMALTIILLIFTGLNDSYIIARPCKRDVSKVAGDYRNVEFIYSPLSTAKLNAICNNVDGYSQIIIGYRALYNFDEYGVGQNLDRMTIQTTSAADLNFIDDLEYYQGGFIPIDENSDPNQELVLERNFTLSDINALYSYILDEDNREFFFSADEYNGLDPIITSHAFICYGNFQFALAISDPEDRLKYWMICKCVDEYPEPGTPLYGLFQMLENDFISQFEE